jgi:hypothetical protein
MYFLFWNSRLLLFQDCIPSKRCLWYLHSMGYMTPDVSPYVEDVIDFSKTRSEAESEAELSGEDKNLADGCRFSTNGELVVIRVEMVRNLGSLQAVRRRSRSLRAFRFHVSSS